MVPFLLSLHSCPINYAFIFFQKAGTNFTAKRRGGIFFLLLFRLKYICKIIDGLGYHYCYMPGKKMSAAWCILHFRVAGTANNVNPSFVPQLSRAEQRMNRLDQCYCERTCTTKGTTYRELESWTDGCKNCTCLVGLPLEFRPRELRCPNSLKIY